VRLAYRVPPPYRATCRSYTAPCRMGSRRRTWIIVAPPMPTRFICSRSAVIPALETLPFTQCHQVCGLAESGGFLKEATMLSWAAALGPMETTREIRQRSGKDAKRRMRY